MFQLFEQILKMVSSPYSNNNNKSRNIFTPYVSLLQLSSDFHVASE